MPTAGEMVRYLGVTLAPEERDAEELGSLPPALLGAGYTVESLCDLFGEVADLSSLNILALPGFVWRCRREDSPRSWMALLFLLCQTVDRDKVEAVIGRDAVQALLRRGVLEKDGDGLYSRLDVYPCQGLCVFTDRFFSSLQVTEHVYALGADSYALARATPRQAVGRTLDLCTGSGIHAILAARHSRQCVGVDIYRRPADFARTNAVLNGVGERCEFVNGDLYEPVRGQRFDLVVANPPWVPSHDPGMEIHRTGGEDGEEVTRRIVAGLPEILEEGGTLAMTVNYPVMGDSTYLHRLGSWLDHAPGWGIALWDFGQITLENYIHAHMPPTGHYRLHQAEFTRWMESYDRLGITAVGIANVYVRRLPAGQPSWTAQKQRALPLGDVSACLDDWLDGLVRFHATPDSPDKDSWRPRLDEHVRQAYKEGLVCFHDERWAGPLRLEGDEAWMAARVNGRTTAARLADLLARRDGLDGETARARVEHALRELGLKQVIR